MKTLKSILILLLSLIIVSCEKEIKLDSELTKSRIVVNSIFSANDTLTVHLSESRSVLYNNGGALPNVEDASVTLFNNGNEIGTLTHKSQGIYELVNPFPIVGQNYEIKVNHPKFENVKAQSICPDTTTIISIDTSTFQNKMKIKISIQDNVDETNYYAFKIYKMYINNYEIEPGIFKIDTTIYADYICTKDINAEIEANSDGNSCEQELLFKDNSFNGSIYDFNFEIQYQQEVKKLIIEVKSISEDLFKYNRTLQLYKENSGNPFGEPVQVYSNITNGFGVFSGYSKSTRIIKL